MHEIILHQGRDKPVRHRHPWVFSGAIARTSGDREPTPGEIVRVCDSKREHLGWGYFNPNSQIAVRLLEWDESVAVNDTWWERKVRESIARRRVLLEDPDTTACRLIYSESDGLPGLIVDRYEDFLVFQALAAGIESVKPILVETLQGVLHPAGIYERSDAAVRELEGIPSSTGVLSGEAPPATVEIRERGFRFLVDLIGGHKTGWYLDQRTNRPAIAPYVDGRDVLDGFCYTGAFTVHALAASARTVTSVDSSAPALEALRRHVALNCPEIPQESVQTECGNAFEILRRFRDQGRSFDTIILDPPKLAANRAQVTNALRAYKDINLLAMKLLRSDGILITFSCSGAVGVNQFQEAVAWAATDAGRSVQILQRLTQADDHPVLVAFPESEYLKGLICRVI